MDSTHASLLIRVRNRADAVAWQEFHRLYYGLIEHYARLRGLGEDDASEMASECMSLLVTKMPDFHYDRKKGRFRAWLRRLVNNKVTDWHRKKKTSPLDTRQLVQLSDSSETPEQIWDRVWQQSHLSYCLEQIKSKASAQQFEAFRLYALEQWPVEKVVDQLGISANQVYLAKSRILAQLKEAMINILGDQD